MDWSQGGCGDRGTSNAAIRIDKLAARLLGSNPRGSCSRAVSCPSPTPCTCPQFPGRHLREASRTLSASTQDLGSH